MQTVPGKGTKVGVRGFGRVTLGTILTKYMHFDALNNFCMSTKAQRAFVGEIDAMNCILLTYVPMDLSLQQNVQSKWESVQKNSRRNGLSNGQTTMARK